MQVGDLTIRVLSDGTFVAGPDYFGAGAGVDGHEDLFDRHGRAWLPIGCFAVRTGDRCVLIDAGMGPASTPAGDLVGGQLLVGLRAAGIATSDITDVVCTHLHSDHVGWLFDLQHRPVFPRATVWFGVGDWRHFVELGNPPIHDHIREGLRRHAGGGRLRLIDRDTAVAPGITAILTPGHTPGHLCVVVSSRDQRALLLGDAVTCPVQLDEPTWHSIGDVDPALADRTRERLWRELEGEDVTGVGAHFPELRFGRVLTGSGRRWWT
ncbi:MAG TPA: MBL fold metallo-hydrolase [Euzebyales bacterium]|nr:MBL fold metallo-hydrolase [Euzebyales bacterium]